MNLNEYIAQLLGQSTLPTESSGQGAWGAYESVINGDQLRQLQALMGYTPPEAIFGDMMNHNLVAPSSAGAYAPLGGGGGLRVERAAPSNPTLEADPNQFSLAYTPNVAGTNTAIHQSDVAGSKNADLMGSLIVGGILGAGLAPELSSLFSGGNMSQAEMMKLMADFEGAGGGLTSAAGATAGGGMTQAIELVKAGFPYTEAAKLTGVSEEALFAALDTGAINGSGAVAAGATGVGGTVPNAMTQFGGAAGDAAIAADAAAIGGGTAAKDGWLASVLGTGGADLVKGLAPDLWKAVIGGIATDKQKSDFEELANKAAEMANPGAYFQRNTIWPALEEAIKAGNKPNADTLAGLHELMQSGADPNSDLRKQSANGFAAANDLVTNPMGNSGYSLADQAAQLYASLNSDPYSNPLISQTFQNAMEAAARKSAASGRLQGGNFLADSRNATTGAVVDASGKLGTQYGNAINSGMNMYDTQFKDALGLGTGAAGTANQNISAGAAGLGSLANLQQADSNYIRDLGNIAGFGTPEAAAAAYKGSQTTANGIDPWAVAVNNGGGKVIDYALNKFLGG